MGNIIFKQEEGIGYLTLNRPDNYNAVDEEMLCEFEEFFNERMYDNSISVIILDGGDAKGFCAGLDMKTYGLEIFNMKPVDAYNAQARLSRMMLGLRKIPQPVICCVHGAAAGIGFSFAMASDIRILADNCFMQPKNDPLFQPKFDPSWLKKILSIIKSSFWQSPGLIRNGRCPKGSWSS